MWALNLMKYRERAEYADGRESSISGMEADDEYAPHEHLRKVGSRHRDDGARGAPTRRR